MHLCTLYTTPPPPELMKTEQARTTSVTTRPAASTNTKKCNDFILNLFCIHKRTFLVQCIVHIGTTHTHTHTHLHVYTCFLLCAVFFLHSQFSLLCLQALALLLSWTGWESTWRTGCILPMVEAILHCHLVVPEISLIYFEFEWFCHEASD